MISIEYPVFRKTYQIKKMLILIIHIVCTGADPSLRCMPDLPGVLRPCVYTIGAPLVYYTESMPALARAPIGGAEAVWLRAYG